jgi:hypothetical protein
MEDNISKLRLQRRFRGGYVKLPDSNAPALNLEKYYTKALETMGKKEQPTNNPAF